MAICNPMLGGGVARLGGKLRCALTLKHALHLHLPCGFPIRCKKEGFVCLRPVEHVSLVSTTVLFEVATVQRMSSLGQNPLAARLQCKQLPVVRGGMG